MIIFESRKDRLEWRCWFCHSGFIHIPNIILKCVTHLHADGFLVAHIKTGNFVKNVDEIHGVFTANRNQHTYDHFKVMRIGLRMQLNTLRDVL
jgi:hypothetical protein